MDRTSGGCAQMARNRERIRTLKTRTPRFCVADSSFGAIWHSLLYMITIVGFYIGFSTSHDEIPRFAESCGRRSMLTLRSAKPRCREHSELRRDAHKGEDGAQSGKHGQQARTTTLSGTFSGRSRTSARWNAAASARRTAWTASTGLSSRPERCVES